MSKVPLRPGPSKEERGFMFVDFQADVSQAIGVGRQKKAFLSKLAHQRRKQESINRLKYSRPFSNNVSQEGNPPQRTAPSEANSMQVPTKRGICSLTRYVGQGYVDPFDTYSVPMTDAMNMYFYHYRVRVVSSAYPLDAARMSIFWSRNAVVSPALLQTFLFLAATHKAALESNKGVSSQVTQKSFRDSIRFRVNAIRTLNDLLQDPTTAAAESTIMLVGAIMSFEALNAEFKSLQAHMEGLKTLIRLKGGLHALNHMTLSKIYHSDVACAALQNSRPSFPMLPRFRSGILQEARMFHRGVSDFGSGIPAALTSLGTRFARTSWYSELDSSMKYTIDVCQRLLLHLEMATIIPNVVMPTDNDLYLLFQHHLLSLHYPIRKNDLNEPIRRTLFIYLFLFVSYFQSFPIMQHLVDALRESIVLRLPYLEVTAPDLLFWILFIGGMASQGYSSHPWFVVHTRALAARLDLEQWDKARPVLMEFFYTGQPGQKGAEDLWNEVLAPSYPYIAPKPALAALEIHRTN
ncbi:hypothetical protein IFM51744_02589 [Aspergillus udagawae]|nr:hypothetical protein IFM51744_02589 [Aspergillus udagawae]GFG18557.1 hypothetical protein IFM5058_09120 [Aspergillus udagawae]